MEETYYLLVNIGAIIIGFIGLFYHFYRSNQFPKFLSIDSMVLQVLPAILIWFFYDIYLKAFFPLQYAFIILLIASLFISTVYFKVVNDPKSTIDYLFFYLIIVIGLNGFFNLRLYIRESTLFLVVFFLIFLALKYAVFRLEQEISEAFQFLILKVVYAIISASFYFYIVRDIALDIEVVLPLIIMLGNFLLDYKLFARGVGKSRKQSKRTFRR